MRYAQMIERCSLPEMAEIFSDVSKFDLLIKSNAWLTVNIDNKLPTINIANLFFDVAFFNLSK